MDVTLGNPSSAHSRCALCDAESGEDGASEACLLCSEAIVWLLCVVVVVLMGVAAMAHLCFLFQRQHLLQDQGRVLVPGCHIWVSRWVKNPGTT